MRTTQLLAASVAALLLAASVKAQPPLLIRNTTFNNTFFISGMNPPNGFNPNASWPTFGPVNNSAIGFGWSAPPLYSRPAFGLPNSGYASYPSFSPTSFQNTWVPYMGNPNVWTPSRFAPNFSPTNSFFAPTNFMFPPTNNLSLPAYGNPYFNQIGLNSPFNNPFFNPMANFFGPNLGALPWGGLNTPVGGQFGFPMAPFGPGNNFAFPMGAPFNGLPGFGLR